VELELWEDKTDKCVLYNTHKSENVKAGVQI